MLNYNFKYFLSLVLISINYQIAFSQESLDPKPIPDTIKNTVIIEDIIISGNDKTKDKIILRELSFKSGDKIEESSITRVLEDSKTQLLKLPLFNYVTMETLYLSEEIIRVKIIVEERWFIWPQISILNNDRNFNTWWETKDPNKLDYRLDVKQYNVLGLNHILRTGISYGYTREYSFDYKNISLDRNQHHFLGVGAGYFAQKSSYFRTFDNKQEYYTSNENNALKSYFANIKYTYRPKHKSKHTLDIAYHDIEIDDSLLLLNPNYLSNNQTSAKFVTIDYQYTFDNRDSRSYPLNGNKLVIEFSKKGFGSDTGSPINLLHAKISVGQYYKIANRLYGSHSMSVKKSLEKEQPYYFKRGLGYTDYLRGFEYYVIDGQDYYISKNTLKFELLPRKISHLDFIPIKKFKKIHYAFYLTSYFDIGYAHEKSSDIALYNNLSNKLVYSTGIGFDIATYYDKVFRFEYSYNSLGETGFYVHFKASI